MPWRDRVKAILYMWFPGQEGGWATADVLLGKENPGGRLPLTFPVRPRDIAALDSAHPERYRGVDKRVVYSEGIFHGYRHFDEHGIAPLHPFGYGLSYTTFAYSNLRSRKAGDGHEVSFTVRNTGRRRGADVPQVYLGSTRAAAGADGAADAAWDSNASSSIRASRAPCVRASSRGSSRTGRATTIAGRWLPGGARSTSARRRADIKLTGGIDVRPRTCSNDRSVSRRAWRAQFCC